MKEIKISVIIPIYNVSLKLFERCITSIEQQPYKFFEIIAVDDGSSLELRAQYDQLCQKYSNIKYIYQKNSGVSTARNTGIEHAGGDYIAFVDADDIVLPDFIAESVELVKKYDEPDLVAGKIKYIYNLSEIEGITTGEQDLAKYETVKLQKEGMDKLKLLMSGIDQLNIHFEITGSPCAKLYKKSMASQIRFPDGITHWEDQIYNRLFLNVAKSAVLVDKVWYFYYQHASSAMHNSFHQMFIERSKRFWDIWNRLNASEAPQIKIEFEKKNVDFFYSAVHVNIVKAPGKWEFKKKLMEELYHERIFQETVNALHVSDFAALKDKCRFWLMKRKCFLLVYWLVKIKTKIKKRKG